MKSTLFIRRFVTVPALAAGLVLTATHADLQTSQAHRSADPKTPPIWLAAGTAATRFGATVFERPGETYRHAFLRSRNTYGRFGAVRIFFPGLPHSWRSIRNNVGKTPVVASFQAPPAEILSGRYDHQLTHWFRTAPKDRLTRWNYWHEPEDDIERGSLNAAAYRRAFTHIERLSDRAHNFRLRSTLILMCWTAEKNSGRSVRTYYPGDAVIDVMAWDCYNAGHRANRYRAPRELFRPAYRASRLRSNNFAVAELGSVVVNGDTGARRARWLHTVAHYLRRHGASFCTYFDSNVGVDYRLSDRPSRRAWRGIVHSQWG